MVQWMQINRKRGDLVDLLNQWILSQNDDGTTLYSLTGTLALVPMVAVMLWYLWRHKIHPLKGIAIGALGYFMTIWTHNLVMWIMDGFAPGRYGAEANLCVAFVYLPLLALLLGAVFNLPYRQVSDQLAVSITALHVLGRVGCIFTGCCYGYPMDRGLWSFQTLDNRFPVVLVEGAFTLGILIWLLIRVGRRGYIPDGKTLPLMLAVYGLCRFATEFLRDNEKLFLGLSDISLHALFMAAVGVAMLLWLAQKERQVVGDESPLPTLKANRR